MSDQIKVLSRDEVDVGTSRMTREQIVSRAEMRSHHAWDVAAILGWREILRRMDEFKAPKKKSWDLGCVGGQSSDVEPQRKKPEPNKQVPEETISSPSHQQWLRERKKQDSLNPQPIEEPAPKWKPENPFKGRHWDEVARDANREDALAETLCIKDLRDELDRQAGRKP